MSVEATKWVWNDLEDADITGTECLVLLALANRSDEEGVSWRGQENIAKRCHLSRETVNRTLKSLAVKGLLECEERRDSLGRQLSCRVSLRMDDIGKSRSIPATLTKNHRDRVSESHTVQSIGELHGDHLLGTRDLDLRSDLDLDLDLNLRSDLRLVRSSRTDTEVNVAVDPDFTFQLRRSIQLQREEKAREALLTPDDLMQGWNKLCAAAGMPRVAELSSSRRRNARLRIKEHPTLEWWKTTFANLAQSRFCRGMVPNPRSPTAKPWQADFDWLLKNDTNALKAHEGRYD